MQKSSRALPLASVQIPWASWDWAHAFILLQFLLQILLLFPQFGVLRVFMRTANFFVSLGFLALLPGPGLKHPAKKAAIAAIAVLVLQLFLNTGLNGFVVGVASVALNLAIIAPLFWASRLKTTFEGFLWLVRLIWGFHALSSVFGILQVYYPGKYQPYLSTTIQNTGSGGKNLMITLANGVETFRPMGLTDQPGGAGISGFYTLLLGIGIALQAKNPLFRLAGAASAVIGLFCIYLSQVRSILIWAVLCLVVLGIVLLRQRKFAQVTALSTGGVLLFTSVFTWAVAVGGTKTFERVMSLFADNPQTIYQQNRGGFLQDTIYNLLPEYPLGAGLGRWGPLNFYFGETSNPLTQPLWAEIQLTGWLYDGGVPLIIAYAVALAITCHLVWKLANNSKLGEIGFWAALVFAYDIGSLVICFNYPLFIGTGGMEFWLLNTCVFVAGYQSWLGSKQMKSELTRHDRS
jgi:hypothetical protein